MCEEIMGKASADRVGRMDSKIKEGQTRTRALNDSLKSIEMDDQARKKAKIKFPQDEKAERTTDVKTFSMRFVERTNADHD
jgi:hypothetical protein